MHASRPAARTILPKPRLFWFSKIEIAEAVDLSQLEPLHISTRRPVPSRIHPAYLDQPSPELVPMPPHVPKKKKSVPSRAAPVRRVRLRSRCEEGAVGAGSNAGKLDSGA